MYDELEARNAALREQIESGLRELRRRTEDIQAARERVAQLTGEATSPDGTVTARVDATGMLTQLELTDRAFERTTPGRLAGVITDVVRQAATEARFRMQEEFRPLTEGALDLPDVVPGAPSLRDLYTVEPPPVASPTPGTGPTSASSATRRADGRAGHDGHDDPDDEPGDIMQRAGW
ncbi:YbaB/EbfC DNA-binding family protein [Streptoalloteichus tenebrarius]|uniref:YbaB/EbfC DNA-binding family protein n=1 Tax=Streptoalloteichus tenebrarius (strain ATCC 17920 / DSM 40477 / JCM 4838 / CBS 697.72 / NBRC 16177 / NCIMB 11028 / NRRL B-12390 / A12253. 1 / ISP 5477) TaxID=1933 RepID=A0ABT1HXK3_STRSD|nr:YbaB/EbfC family nucleoid-associated protein [Streptoalloteichus tenebrarius]MCP2260253.1 YbaB/EbfC DNA-binding family protein [Streptoalloteichus tenebrarius]BFF02543.1 YbaB/EbfC family nucleoid-associated protein [Streptoalloteichus tenebrarius]